MDGDFLNVEDNLIVSPTETAVINDIDQALSKRAPISRKSILEIILYAMILVTLGVMIYLFILFFYIDRVEIILSSSDIPKSYNDSRGYSVIQLRNDIKIALVSDPGTATSALSFTVGAGGFHDEKIPGMIHLTARLMLLRSHQFNRTFFTNHLSEFFGKYQLIFGDEETIFTFDAEKDGFQSSLNIFAEMMTHPLFNEEIVEFEKRVIETQYGHSSRQRTVQERHILNEVVFKNKLYFPNGNKLSFEGYSHSQLAVEAMEVYNRHYYGGNINIAIVSSQSLKELKGMAIKAFKNIKQHPKNRTVKEAAKHLTRADLKLGQFFSYSHQTDLSINYHFFFDKRKSSNNDELLLHYLVAILNDRASKSFYALSDVNAIIASMTSRVEVIDSSLIHFTIEISFCKIGWVYSAEITEKMFNMLRLVRESTPKVELYRELNAIAMQSFLFEAFQRDDLTYVTELSHFMNYYTNISSGFLGKNYHPPYDEEALSHYLSLFTPDNCAIVFVMETPILQGKEIADLINSTSAFDASWKKEKWYGLQYAHDALSKKAISRLNMTRIYDEALAIRGLNPHLSQSTHTILPNLTDDNEMRNRTPAKLINVHHAKLWHKLDRTFFIPKSIVLLHVITPFIRSISITEYYLNRMYFQYLKYSINKELYQYKDSGNAIDLTEDENGIVIEVNCYSDLLEEILEKVSFILFNVKKERDLLIMLNILVAKAIFSLINSMPSLLGQTYFATLLKRRVQNINTIIGPIDILEFYRIEQMTGHIYLTALFYGNINQTQSESLFSRLFSSKLRPNSSQIESHLVVFSEDEIKAVLAFHHLLKGSYIIRLRHTRYEYNEQAVINYFYVDKYSRANDILPTLLSLLWEKNFQNSLYNTTESIQVVQSGKVVYDGKIYFTFAVQTFDDPKDINFIMDEAIKKLRQKVESTTDDQLYYAKEVFISKKNTKDASLNSKAKDVFNEILTDNLQFEKVKYERSMLKEYSQERILELFDKVFYSNVGKLSIQLYNMKNLIKLQAEKYFLNSSIVSNVTDDYLFFQR